MKDEVREASARPTWKWSAIAGKRRPKESLKFILKKQAEEQAGPVDTVDNNTVDIQLRNTS